MNTQRRWPAPWAFSLLILPLGMVYGFNFTALPLWFAKTPARREINNIAAAISPPFCYKSGPCFASSGSASECWYASFARGEVSFSRISLCVNSSLC